MAELFDQIDQLRRGADRVAVATLNFENGVWDDQRIRRAMSHLSEDQRQVLFLRYMGGLTAPEVAEVLGKTDGAVRSLQHRGERALARLLDEELAAVPSGPGESS